MSISLDSGDNAFTADDGDNTVLGLDGADTLSGLGGQDSLDGGNGADSLSGGEGADTLAGGTGPDTLAGGEGDDRLLVSWEGYEFDLFFVGVDLGQGEPVDLQTAFVSVSIDAYLGGAGGDTLFGVPDNAVVFDFRGSPDAFSGIEHVRLGESRDVFIANTGWTEALLVEGEGGEDSLIAAQGADTLRGGGGRDLLAGREGADSLEGGDAADTLLGGTGSDLLDGGTGADSLAGGEGADTLAGGTGPDTLAGGEGDDRLLVSWEGYELDLFFVGVDLGQGAPVDLQTAFVSVSIDAYLGGAGGDTLFGVPDNAVVFDFRGSPDAFSGIEHVRLGESRDVFIANTGWTEALLVEGEGGEDSLIAAQGADTLRGGGGRDLLAGREGADSLDGGDAADTLLGGTGSDLLDGGTGADSLAGGEGDDVMRFVEGADTIEGGGGRDAVDFGHRGPGQGVFVFEDGVAFFEEGGDAGRAQWTGIERVFGGGGNDTADFALAANATLDGRGGDDLLVAHTGADSLAGGDGNDRLEGRDGTDTIGGGIGADTLLGGSGNDSIAGGDGDDLVLWETRSGFVLGRPTVFTDGHDTVALGGGTNMLRLAGWTGPTPVGPGTGTAGDWTYDTTGSAAVFANTVFGGSVTVTDWTLGANSVSCFYPGTLIATPAGARAVETLAAGEPVLTVAGAARPVRWMGRQTVSARFGDPLRILPIRIRAGALGQGLPRRDLLLSPCHAVLLEGLLVQAGALVNGTTVTREGRVPERFTYHHVELATHELILAEGVPAETFLDTGERPAFDNSVEREARLGHLPPIEEMALPRVASARQLPASLRARLAAAA